jgi:hypothetical protein
MDSMLLYMSWSHCQSAKSSQTGTHKCRRVRGSCSGSSGSNQDLTRQSKTATDRSGRCVPLFLFFFGGFSIIVTFNQFLTASSPVAVLVVQFSVGVVGDTTDGDGHVIVGIDLRKRHNLKPQQMCQQTLLDPPSLPCHWTHKQGIIDEDRW